MLKRIAVFTIFVVCILSPGYSKQIENKINTLKQDEFLFLEDWDWESISKCKNGTIVLFNSAKGSSYQVMWAAFMFADFNYPVVIEEDSLLCVFTDARVKGIKEKHFPKEEK
ncbi:MAG: hypothetical protein HPY53_01270 [Brevinematales bacterium]|nr:hypothetical protein [Brevinematales bacterium]